MPLQPLRTTGRRVPGGLPRLRQEHHDRVRCARAELSPKAHRLDRARRAAGPRIR